MASVRRPLRGVRSARLVALSLTLLFVLGTQLGGLHLASVRHALCVEHDAFEHADAHVELGRHAGRGSEAERGPVLDAASQGEAEGHEACSLSLARRTDAAGDAGDGARVRPAPRGSGAHATRETARHGPIDPLARAPKQSPPA